MNCNNLDIEYMQDRMCDLEDKVAKLEDENSDLRSRLEEEKCESSRLADELEEVSNQRGDEILERMNHEMRANRFEANIEVLKDLLRPFADFGKWLSEDKLSEATDTLYLYGDNKTKLTAEQFIKAFQIFEFLERAEEGLKKIEASNKAIEEAWRKANNV